MFEGKARVYPGEALFRSSTLGYAPGLTHKYYTELEWLAKDKHSSILKTFVNYGRKTFYKIGTWPNDIWSIYRNPNRPFSVENLFGRPTSDSFVLWEPFDSKTQQFLKIGKKNCHALG